MFRPLGLQRLGPAAVFRSVRQTAMVVGGTGAVAFVAGGLVFRARNASDIPHREFNLDGRTYVVTGGTSGIGKAVVEQLVSSGARVFVGARDRARLASLSEEMGGSVDVFPLDLADASSVAAFATRVEQQCSGRLHGLVNNAAVIQCEQRRNAAGVEMTFAANALGPFQLTNALLPLLLKTGEYAVQTNADTHNVLPRVVNVGSRLESKGWVDPGALLETGDMFQLSGSASKDGKTPRRAPKDVKEISPMLVYASSKLCNSLFTQELNRRLQGR